MPKGACGHLIHCMAFEELQWLGFRIRDNSGTMDYVGIFFHTYTNYNQFQPTQGWDISAGKP